MLLPPPLRRCPRGDVVHQGRSGGARGPRRLVVRTSRCGRVNPGLTPLHQSKSDYHTQHAGIRQGCPLSPYLFVMVMSALWHDLHAALPTSEQADALLYADDTLLYARSRLKQDAPTESYRYGLKLNYGKCEFIGINYPTAHTPQILQQQKTETSQTSQVPGRTTHRQSATTSRG